MFLYLERYVMVLLCLGLLLVNNSDTMSVVVTLILILIINIGYILKGSKYMLIIIAIYIIVAMRVPELVFGVPVIEYEIISCFRTLVHLDINNSFRDIRIKDKGGLALEATVVIFGCIVFYNALDGVSVLLCFLLSILILLAAIININIYLINMQKDKLIKEHDSGQELMLQLKNKNKQLIDKQDADIKVATLDERNRIARDIHDNVGHLLSRSILATAAIETINTDKTIEEMLNMLQETLNQAMDSIRKSVHDIYDESLDLDIMIKELLKPLDRFQVDYQYGIDSEVPKELKYCIISVIKEAVTNIIKYSNGDRVSVYVMEQPAFFQLQIYDNGESNNPQKEILPDTYKTSGMGLDSIRQRVQSFNGKILISSLHGFRIFINIPKEGDKT